MRINQRVGLGMTGLDALRTGCWCLDRFDIFSKVSRVERELRVAASSVMSGVRGSAWVWTLCELCRVGTDIGLARGN